MGINALNEKNFGYPNADLCELKPGAVAFVTQSGGTVQYLAVTGAHRGLHFNYLDLERQRAQPRPRRLSSIISRRTRARA